MNTGVQYDVIVVGGSYAGLAASLQLARARRRVLVIDAGVRRNRFASHAHGFLGQDGRPPGDIIADARAQVAAYPTVEWVDGLATTAAAAGADGGFAVEADNGETYAARRVILASGVVDELPELPGLKERWGSHVFHCPYCHGYELGGGPVGVLASSAMSMHHALMLPDWGPTTLFLNGSFEPDAAQLAELARRGAAIERRRVSRIVGGADVQLEDGVVVPLAGLFTLTRMRIASPLAAQLGCALEESPIGEFVTTDAMKQTTVAGVYSCGDMARMAGSVTFAVGDGAMAGFAAHQSLMSRPA